MVATVPPLRGPTRHKTARKRKSGRSGRDEGIRKEKTQEHSPFDFVQGEQEWLCHREGGYPWLEALRVKSGPYDGVRGHLKVAATREKSKRADTPWLVARACGAGSVQVS